MKIAFTNYLNSRPIHFNFDHPEVEIILADPAQTQKLLEDGDIDYAQLSLHAYLERQENYTLHRQFCIACPHRRIDSVALFSNYPLKELTDKNIHLTAQSLTSTELLRIILNKYLQISVDYQRENIGDCDACLLIGDDALAQRKENRWLYVYDLVTLWNDWQSLPFVFAVFVGKNGEQLPDHIALALSNNLQKNLHDLPPSLYRESFPYMTAQEVESYLSLLKYDLGSLERTAIQVFAQQAEYANINRM